LGAHRLDRRALLAAGAAGAILPLTPAWAAETLSASPLPGGLTLIAGAGTNVVAARGPQGAVLVDAGIADRAPALEALALQKTGSKSVAALFNTCWRPGQTGANDHFAAKGAKIIGHENTRLWMGTEIPVRWEDKIYPPRDPKARPSETLYTTASMKLGGETVDYGYLLQAHTDGDIYVFFRKANVLVTGAAVSSKGWPIIDWSTGGWIGGMVRSLEALVKLVDDKTVIVPGDGPVMTKAELVQQHAMYVDIMGRLKKMMESGFGTAQVLKGAPAKDYEAVRGDPSLFLKLAFASFWGHVRQFDVV
jgi:glyoxylase-like metal-dependent hydrolase (beta-lactamase superfamily II)